MSDRRTSTEQTRMQDWMRKVADDLYRLQNGGGLKGTLSIDSGLTVGNIRIEAGENVLTFVDINTGETITLDLASDEQARQQGWIPSPDRWSFASDNDAPIYVIQVDGDLSGVYSPGTRLRVQQGGGTSYFIVVGVSLDGGSTSLQVYGGAASQLDTGPIDERYYSHGYAPGGFDPNPALWTETLVDASNPSVANPSNDNWYNLGGLSFDLLPGVWKLSYDVQAYLRRDPGDPGSVGVVTTLSTDSSSESDPQFTAFTRSMTTIVGVTGDVGMYHVDAHHRREAIVQAAETTPYYLLQKQVEGGTVVSIEWMGSGSPSSPTVISAVSAYL